MTCHNCRIDCRKFGKRNDRQRYQCTQCGKVFTDPRDNTLDGMYLPFEKAVAEVFIEGLRHATTNDHFQVTSDGFTPYRSALSDRVDFAQLIKVYRAPAEGEARYSPAEVASLEEVPVMGRPDPARMCTSIVERSNLSTRMSVRRFTRLTNAFSKKWENHWAAVALWFEFYDFCGVYKTLRMTPAMAAGISDQIWSVRELLEAG